MAAILSHEVYPHSGDVRLNAVDRIGADQVVEIGLVIPVFARSHVEVEARAHLAKTCEVVGRYGFVEPCDSVFAFEHTAYTRCLFDAVSTVGIDEDLHVVYDLARERHPVEIATDLCPPRLSHLDLHAGNLQVADPAFELRCVALSS